MIGVSIGSVSSINGVFGSINRQSDFIPTTFNFNIFS